MKKFVLIASIVSLLAGCKKKCEYEPCGVVAPASEIASVQSYLTSNNITATQHCSGIFYAVDNAGSGKQPNGCSTVSVNYEGKLTNGTVFDKTTGAPASFSLDGVVIGFANGILQVKNGGKVRIYIPPSLGYGSTGRPPAIPGNSILIFTVEVLDVQ